MAPRRFMHRLTPGSVKWDMKKQQRTSPGEFTDKPAAGNSPGFRGLGRQVAELNWRVME